MTSVEFSVDGERFRVSERLQPGGGTSYDFAWVNGPAEGSYGFTVGRSVVDGASAAVVSSARMTGEQLVEEARAFVAAFYADDGIGPQDFPGHIRADGTR